MAKQIVFVIILLNFYSCGILGSKEKSDDDMFLIGLLGLAGNSSYGTDSDVKLNFGSSVALGKTNSSSLSRSNSQETIVGIGENGELINIVSESSKLPSLVSVHTTTNIIYIRFSNKRNFQSETGASESCLIAKVSKSDKKIVCVDTEVASFSASDPIKFDKDENLYYLGKNSKNENILRNEAKTDFLPANNNVTINNFYASQKDKVVVNGTSSGSPWVRILEPNKSTVLPETLNYNGVSTVYTDPINNYVYMFNKKDEYGVSEISNLPITKTLDNGYLINYFADGEAAKVSNPGAFTRCRDGVTLSAFTVEHFNCITTQFDNTTVVSHTNNSVKHNFIVANDTDATQPLRGNSRRSLYRLLPDGGGKFTIRYIPLLSNLATREVAVTWVSKVVSNGDRLLIAGRKNSQYVFYTFNPLSESGAYPGFYNSPTQYLSDMNIEIFEITPNDNNNVILEGIDHDTNRNVVVTLNLVTLVKNVTYNSNRVSNISKL